MAPIWHITLFVQLTVRRAEEKMVSLTMRKSGTLLAYLAYHRGKPQSRERLADLLWPEITSAKEGREHVRSSLHELRKRLDAPGTPLDQSAVLSTRETLCLNPATAITDVTLYQQALEMAKRAGSKEEKRRRLQQAVALCGGELLHELSDEWVLAARERLLRQQQNALAEMITLHENAGDIPQAIETALLKRLKTVMAPAIRSHHDSALIATRAALGETAFAIYWDEGQAYTLEQVVAYALQE